MTLLDRGGRGNTDDLDPANPRSAGAQALARVLGDHGVKVTVVRSQRELLDETIDGMRILLRAANDLAMDVVNIKISKFGGLTRAAPMAKYALHHGDVAVWGGKSRLRYHGVAMLKDGVHARLGRLRINLTFRRAVS